MSYYTTLGVTPDASQAVCKHKHGDVYVASRTYSTLNRQWISHDPVTHWMPLPEPPEPKP